MDLVSAARLPGAVFVDLVRRRCSGQGGSFRACGSKQLRPTDAATAAAESLPFEDRSFDVAMAVSTVHHWGFRLRGCVRCGVWPGVWWCSRSTPTSRDGRTGSGSPATTCPSSPPSSRRFPRLPGWRRRSVPVLSQRRTGTANRPNYSGTHHRHGLPVLALTDVPTEARSHGASRSPRRFPKLDRRLPESHIRRGTAPSCQR